MEPVLEDTGHLDPAPVAAETPIDPVATDEPRPRRRATALAVEILKTVLIVIVLVVTIRTFVVEAYVIHGASMEPEYHDRDRLLISKFSQWVGKLGRGDIIVFEHRHKRLIKRIVGLPDETIELRDGRVYIDGSSRPLEEPYLAAPDGTFHPPERVPSDHYFVLGDNRPVSNDSRRFGAVPIDDVLGKAWVKFWGQSNAASADTD